MSNRVMSRLGRSVQDHRRAAAEDDGVAMVIVLLLIMVILAMTVTLVSTLVAQPPAIYLAQRRTKTIYASQAGIQAAVGQLRNTPLYTSGTNKGYPIPADLPCGASGTVDGSSSYSVTISYYNANPTGQSTTWLNTAANIVSCTTGSGTTVTPAYALIRSSGSGASVPALASTAGVRTIQAIYAFNVTNVNIPGGPIYDLSKSFCLTATSAAANSTITFQPVATITATQPKLCPTLATQNWVYNTSYQLQLASTVGTSTPLCITGSLLITGNAVLSACAAVTIEQWAWTGAYTWIQGTDGTNNCLGWNGTLGTGTLLLIRLGGCNGQFYPSSAVGAGGAGYTQHQIVNYMEFGRCMDVTAQDVTNQPYISYPCKQDPTNTGNFTWNQKWFYSEPTGGATSLANQTIYVSPPGYANFCLTSPASGTSVPAYPSNDPTFQSCTGAANQNWTRVFNTGDYASSYLFQDNWGHCLDLDTTHLNAGWSTIVIAACNGSTSQKWNAVATTNSSTLGSYQQVTG